MGLALRHRWVQACGPSQAFVSPSA